VSQQLPVMACRVTVGSAFLSAGTSAVHLSVCRAFQAPSGMCLVCLCCWLKLRLSSEKTSEQSHVRNCSPATAGMPVHSVHTLPWDGYSAFEVGSLHNATPSRNLLYTVNATVCVGVHHAAPSTDVPYPRISPGYVL